ncbi:hypothetical protein SUBVAR_07035 [Subdoligranulum variabile DSM 15176]|uniref:Uncharacterized protein n=1 Tax=Subdoligranulum variabile DSM 15176 TaxID=411471 RepID=D1PRK5_9FIRM|nr:hypothetical protein SUBVAR_07035 [Subdoligranulum variabile DSM 15176]
MFFSIQAPSSPLPARRGAGSFFHHTDFIPALQGCVKNSLQIPARFVVE